MIIIEKANWRNTKININFRISRQFCIFFAHSEKLGIQGFGNGNSDWYVNSTIGWVGWGLKIILF